MIRDLEQQVTWLAWDSLRQTRAADPPPNIPDRMPRPGDKYVRDPWRCPCGRLWADHR